MNVSWVFILRVYVGGGSLLFYLYVGIKDQTHASLFSNVFEKDGKIAQLLGRTALIEKQSSVSNTHIRWPRTAFYSTQLHGICLLLT